MKNWPVEWVGIGVAVALCTSVMWESYLGAAVNRCCIQMMPYAPCSNCVLVVTNPNVYVDVGSRNAFKCKPTGQSLNCDEENSTCFNLVNADYYESGNCSLKIGIISVVKNIPQCTSNDDMCGGGG